MPDCYWLSFICCVIGCVGAPSIALTGILEPLVQWANIPIVLASPDKKINGEWVAAGTSAAYSIQRVITP